MIVLGVDPDLHNTGLALADEHRVYVVEVVQVDKKLKGEEAVVAMCRYVRGTIARLINDFYKRSGDVTRTQPVQGMVVEAQQLYLGGSSPKAKPDDLLNLANVTGSVLGSFAPDNVRRPRPQEWKGDVPKPIHQARICTRYGWKYSSKSDHVVPDFAPGTAAWLTKPVGADEIMPLSNWKHVLDAVGLSYWGSTKGFQ